MANICKIRQHRHLGTSSLALLFLFSMSCASFSIPINLIHWASWKMSQLQLVSPQRSNNSETTLSAQKCAISRNHAVTYPMKICSLKSTH
jgi:hypothetical protein